ncbi:MAG: hypothetical protein JOZ22_01065 [Acidobacteriia bacterium]|nr:hypothetical protein [Terriglobia bacterium]
MGHVTSFLVMPALLFSSTIPVAAAPNLILTGSPSGENLAFERYLASMRKADPFADGPVLVTIEAWSPSLHQESRVWMLRRQDASGRSNYQIVDAEGETGAALDLILPYLEEQQRLESVPQSARAITPTNYKFHYQRMVETEDAPAYVFRIAPKQKRDGLIQGELWVDSESGMAVARAGYVVKTPYPLIRKMEVSEDTKLVEGAPAFRISHVVIQTRQAGRSLLTISERLLSHDPNDDNRPSQPSPVLRSDFIVADSKIAR